MSKKSLYKLFYIDKALYDAEYKARFNSNDTIHLDIHIGEHPAFIHQTVDMYKTLVSIERINTEIVFICNKLPKKALSHFQNRCMIDEIVLTNNIEGVVSTRKEISKILQDLSRRSNKERFIGLIKKYLTLMNGDKVPLQKPEDIRKIYDDIFYDEIRSVDTDDLPDGTIFRAHGVDVLSVTGKEIHHGIMPESKIISTMEKALEFLNNEEYDYLIRIAVFHYLFGYIHPFYDGNGRTSRFISSYLLSERLNYLAAYRLSYTIKENIKEYYDAFKVCNHYNNKGDLTPFVEMFLNIIHTSMEQLLNALSERAEKLDHYADVISYLPLSEDNNIADLYWILICAALFSNMGITMKELQQELDISYNTVRSRLEKIPEHLVLINHQGNRAYYLLNLQEVDKLV